MVIPMNQDAGQSGDTSGSPIYRSMPVYSARSFTHGPSPYDAQNRGYPGQRVGSFVGDTRYSTAFPYRSPAFGSPKSPGVSQSPRGSTPSHLKSILKTRSTNGLGTRNLRSSAAAGSPASQPPSNPVNELQQRREAVEKAARITEFIYSKDSEFPSMFQALLGRDTTGSTLYAVSGTLEQDYPGVVERGLLSKKFFTAEPRTPIPVELTDLLNQTGGSGSCSMGLLPEINRAWMTIGSDLYFWDFWDGSDLSFYDGLKEPIVALALVHAKPNIFKANLRHILCVTTPSQIVLLGFLISRDDSSFGLATPVKSTMELVAQPFHTLATDSTIFSVVTGSSSGRIFLGGNDGYLYEVNYQAQRGWIQDKCWKTNLTKSLVSKYLPKFLYLSPTDPIKQIVIDSRRHILFSLTAGGSIDAYDLGSDGTGFSNLGSMSLDTIINSVITASKKTVEPNLVKNLLSVAVIEHGELNLVAVAETGTRLYFTCYLRPYQGAFASSTRPSVFQLAHIRLPPGYSPMSTVLKPSGANFVHYSNGILAISSPTSRDESALWIITPFIYPTLNYAELSAIHLVKGSTIDIQEVAIRKVDPAIFEQPEVMVQHLPYRRELIILTSQGTTILKALKPYELLRDLLIERRGPENVKGHFEMIPNRVQPLANCVLLASHPFMFADNTIHGLATKAIYMYGCATEPTQRAPQKSQQRVAFDLPNTSGDVTTGFRSQSPNFDHQRSWSSPANRSVQSPTSPFGPPALSSTLVQGSPLSSGGLGPGTQGAAQDALDWPYSVKHDAIYTNVGRILASFWNTKLLRTGLVEGTETHVIMPNISGEQVSYAIHFLQSLYEFIMENPSFYMGTYKAESSATTINAETQTTPEARRLLHYEMEKSSLASLKVLLSHSLEVLGMWKILCDHQLHIILQGVDDRLLHTTLRDLIVAGSETIPIIINALISKYLGDNAAVDAISLRLRDVCPTLFRNEDAIGSKVAEILQKVKQTTNPSERETMLKDSLILCEQICGYGRVNIRNFCMQFAELGFPLGAIKLCESAANAVDPNHLAVRTLKPGTSVDPAATQAYANRCEIYKIVFEILDMYFNCSNQQAPVFTGRLADIPSEKARFYADETYHGILGSEDEIFHIMLYNWLLERNLFERLLQIKHQFLNSFLQRAAETAISGKWPRNANDTQILDLLWRHHEMNGDHMAAAQILNRLADSTTTGLNFDERLENLARANNCLKGAGRRAPGDELESLEEKLEVAQIQKSILVALETRLSNISGTGGSVYNHPLSSEIKLIREAIQRLNSQLFPITVLFQDFAEPFKLHEIKLDIFSAAGHIDKTLIESFYADIIEAELTASSRDSMESQLELIRRKIVYLGRKYFSSPIFFPVDYLVEHLEAMKPMEKVDQAWVVKIMFEIGIPFTDLIGIYERLWKKTTQRTNAAPGYDVHITRVVMSLINSFLDGSVEVRLSRFHMKELVEKCKDLVGNMVIEFSSRFEPEADEINHQLAIIKEQLETR